MAVSWGASNGKEYWDLRGLSSDAKPTSGVPNGSKFEEIDTGNEYKLDADTGTWYLQPAAGGGGGGGGPGGGTGNVSSADAQTIVVLDRAEYNALPAKDPKTLYLIKG